MMWLRILIALLLCYASVGTAWGAFPTGWGRSHEIIIQSSEVPANVSNFPVLITEVNVNSEAFGAAGSNQALEGGGDVRVSSDSAGTSRLSIEVVSWDSVNSTCEVWVKVASIASGSNTTIWIWYHKSGESQPARGAAFGAEAVWTEGFVGVWHLEEDQAGIGTANVYKDMTSGANHGADSVSATNQDGKIGAGNDFDGSDDNIIVPYDAALEPSNDMTLTMWIKRDGAQATYAAPITKNVNDGESQPYATYLFQFDNTSDDILRFGTGHDGGLINVVISGTAIGDATWNYVAGTYTDTGNEQIIYVGTTSLSGDTVANTRGALQSDIDHDLEFGSFWDSPDHIRFFDGNLDEIRLIDEYRTYDWLTAEINNQSDPNAFALEQTPYTPGGAAPAAYGGQAIMIGGQ